MKEKTYTIVTTTINIPRLLEDYAKDALKFNRKIDKFIVVGDKKSPPETADFCSKLEQDFGIKCIYLSPEDQEKDLEKFPDFKNYLPWNCVQRRNVGLHLAYQGESDIIVTIDDDNFIYQTDYLKYHSHIGDIQEIETVESPTGWWNVCEMLKEKKGIPFYHRGHPLSKRWLGDEDKKTIKKIKGRVVVNAGLWLEEPDVDALTRLYFPVDVSEPSKHFKEKIACDIGTWAPFNTQNTALAREIIPAYFLCPHNVGRNHDIWASYMVRHISDHLGHLVTYGSPLVRQERNPHNLFNDFDTERFGLEYNDIFLEALRSCKLSSKDYKGAFSEVTQQFPEQIKRVCDKNNIDFHLFDKLSEGLRLWSEIF